jgi:hypothetical protein
MQGKKQKNKSKKGKSAAAVGYKLIKVNEII